MEENNIADSTVHGVTDISGVKDAAEPYPERLDAVVSHDADGTNENASAENDCSAALEEEFEQLINGRFSEVYKRRTESIIRKRLRSGKAHPKVVAENGVIKASGDLPSDTRESTEAANNTNPPSPLPTNGDGVRAAKEMNSSRPIENGIGGSCGVISKINVNALNGRDVLSILKRVGAGERINFK